METIEFLDLVWGTEPCWVDLPSKAGAHWIPYPAEWPSDRAMIRRRIESCLEDNEDVYFSCARFRSRGRRIVDVLPTQYLWADLDKVDPVFLDEDKVLPTISWESSPGRYQCMWRLNTTLDPNSQTKLARALTRAIGADRGGYDLTQVLRPPGTRNFKYGDELSAPQVELLWYFEDVVYDVGEISAAVRDMADAHGVSADELLGGGRPRETLAERARGAGVNISRLPARARRLLNTPADRIVVGERSDRLYELNRLLYEHGLEEDQIYDLVVGTPWNKWEDDGDSLRRDIAKAAEKGRKTDEYTDEYTVATPSGSLDHVEVAGDQDRVGESPFVSYADFISSSIVAPKWMVQDLWSSSSHGILGGEPKTMKSILGMALGVSIASGRPFLAQEKFTVSDSGPVLMIQEENAPWVVQDRLRKIAHLYGLIGSGDVEFGDAPVGSLAAQTIRLDFPQEVPFKMLNNYGFSLLNDEHREMLEDAIQAEGAKALILDPLYLVAPGLQLNSAADVTPVLKYLMDIRYKLDCAVMVVHHMHKPSSESQGRRSGQRLMGSGLFHGWIESALYFEDLGGGRVDDDGAEETKRIKVDREFRNVAPRTALEIELGLGEPGELEGMEAHVWEFNQEGKDTSAIERIFEGRETVSTTELMQKMSLSRDEVHRLMKSHSYFKIVEEYRTGNRIKRKREAWSLVVREANNGRG